MTIVIGTALMLGGCATTRNGPDPYESANRAVYKFNDSVDRAAFKPLAKGYKKITPNWFRKGVDNFFTNLEQPITLVNELLQGKPRAALTTTGRLVVNTVFGVGGLFDPASASGIPLGDEDFGQTLGRWGVPAGPYVMLPILGPSTMRDAPSKLFDWALDPRTYGDLSFEESWGLWLFEGVDRRARLLSVDESVENAYDPYAFVRNAWLQRRAYAVSDGEMPEEDDEEWMEEEAPAEDEVTDSSPPSPAPQPH